MQGQYDPNLIFFKLYSIIQLLQYSKAKVFIAKFKRILM
jgi:hypothetical protein